jgi:hypothetical protein
MTEKSRWITVQFTIDRPFLVGFAQGLLVGASFIAMLWLLSAVGGS